MVNFENFDDSISKKIISFYIDSTLNNLNILKKITNEEFNIDKSEEINYLFVISLIHALYNDMSLTEKISLTILTEKMEKNT